MVDQERVEVTLQKRQNTLLVKCGQNADGWNLHTRIRTDPVKVMKRPSNATTRMLYERGNPVVSDKSAGAIRAPCPCLLVAQRRPRIVSCADMNEHR